MHNWTRRSSPSEKGSGSLDDLGAGAAFGRGGTSCWKGGAGGFAGAACCRGTNEGGLNGLKRDEAEL